MVGWYRILKASVFVFGLALGFTLVYMQPRTYTELERIKEDVRRISRDQINRAFNRTHPNRDKSGLAKGATGIAARDVITARELYERVRVVCMVVTSPKTLQLRAAFIQKTWGPRCQKTIFISSAGDPSFPTVGVGSEGRHHITQKVLKGIRFIYNTEFNKGASKNDWLFIAEDDTYAIVENLRYFLKDKNPAAAMCFGDHFQEGAHNGHLKLGSGIVLSRESLRRLTSTNLASCFSLDGDSPDVTLSGCLYDVGVFIGNSTDRQGKSRFHYFPPDVHIHRRFSQRYRIGTKSRGGIEGMSDYAISFHHMTGAGMMELEYLARHLVPVGVPLETSSVNQPESHL